MPNPEHLKPTHELPKALDAIVGQLLTTQDELLQRCRELNMWLHIHRTTCTHHANVNDTLSTLHVCEAHAHLIRLWGQWYQQWTSLHLQMHALLHIFDNVNALFTQDVATHPD